MCRAYTSLTTGVVRQYRTTSLALRGQDPTVMLSSILSQLSVHRLHSQTRNFGALCTGYNGQLIFRSL